MIENIYFRVAYAVLIFMFMFCGTLRLCNLWPQSVKPVNELYPARRMVSCIYFAVLILLPCVLHPQSHDARLLARCFWILYIPAAASLALKRFFYGDRLHKRLRVMAVGGVPLAISLTLSVIACAGDDVLLPYTGVVIRMASITGVLLTAYLLHVILWLGHIIPGSDDCSSDNPFPRNFAYGILIITIVGLCVAWCDFLWGDTMSNTIFAAVIGFLGAAIIMVILHPQRVAKKAVPVAISADRGAVQIAILPERDEVAAAIEKATDTCSHEKERLENILQDSTSDETKKYKLSDTQLDNMERRIRKLVEGRKLYLDPNLKQETLEKELGINRSYLSEFFARRFDSLSCYLRSLRMEHAIRYAVEHPGAKQSEVALHSGFGSENSYYRARKAYEAAKQASNTQIEE